MKTFEEYYKKIQDEYNEKNSPPQGYLPPDFIRPQRTTLEVSNEILVMAMNDFIKDLQEMRNENI